MIRTCMAALLVAYAAALATGATALPQPVQNTLTAIDSVPTKTQLDNVFPIGEALVNLSTIAQDTSADIGIRLRAIHALAKYCPVPCSNTELAHQSLSGLIAGERNETSGSSVLLLRAAIETIGALHVADDVNVLVPLLDHGSRDVRAATARALRDLCNTQAITPLRVRYTSESTEQVKLAISEALRVLGQCSAGT
jgi:HEAT repeat protein